MPRSHAPKACLIIAAALASVCLCTAEARAALTQRCNWGVTAPTVWPASVQVMMTPVVLDFGGPPLGTSKVAFISFGTAADANRDGNGVLRVIDGNCNLIASYPSPGSPLPPPNCPANLNTTPRLAPLSGLAAGNLDANPDVEIVALLDDLGPPITSNHFQLVAFTLSGGALIPKWCSAATALPAGDLIPSGSYPAIAQLDAPPHVAAQQSEIIVDNKVFNFDGTLRYTGFSHGGNNCSTQTGGSPCPRSRAAVVADLTGGASRPQLVTGRGVYRSVPFGGTFWTGSLGWLNPQVSQQAPSLVYPAVAELDPTKLGPEIVVTDTMTTTVRVLSSAGIELASRVIPEPGCPGTACPKCGGPPVIGEANYASPGPEIGVACRNVYTMFKYSVVGGVGSLAVMWSSASSDPSGQTASTIYSGPVGARVYYADSQLLRVYDGASGALLYSVSNSSATAAEGPVIAALDAGKFSSTIVGCKKGRGLVIVGANKVTTGSDKGLRIFNDDFIGQVGSCWNQHSFHVTNLLNSFGAIPTIEPASWISPARNTYRVQQ